MNPSLPCAAIILAAGSSRRMGVPKALLRLGNQTFLDSLIEVFAPLCSPVITVLGEHAREIRSGCKLLARTLAIVNPHPESGQFSSLQLGLKLVPGLQPVFFHPVDAPGISRETVERLLAGLEGFHAAGPVHGGRHGHPMLLDWRVRQVMLSRPVTSNAREVLRWWSSRTNRVEVPDPAVLRDVDEPDDYQALFS